MQEKSAKTKIDLKGKTVLVTGAAGFIGSFLSERLLSDFEDIRVIGFDSVNDYYDIRLKESRLEKLQKHRNFIFIKANLADKDKVSEVFRADSCQPRGAGGGALFDNEPRRLYRVEYNRLL